MRTASDMNSVIPAPGVLHLEEKRNGSAISCANPSSEAATHFLAPAHAIVSRRQPALPNPVSRIESDQSRRTDNVAPPPINRSIKPRTGPRPGTSNVSHELRPPSPSLNEGASPFTTPPSSDESSTSTSKAISRVDSKSQKPKSAKGSFMKSKQHTAMPVATCEVTKIQMPESLHPVQSRLDISRIRLICHLESQGVHHSLSAHRKMSKLLAWT